MRKDIEEAILGMYTAIDRAAILQQAGGHPDHGQRSGITSGKHLQPVISIVQDDLIKNGFNSNEIYAGGRKCTLPGWFRPTKNWDLPAFDQNELVSAVEFKSISSSLSNNTNNRAEEAIGSVVDAVEAYHERLFGDCNIPPVMGYAMIVRDCKESRESGGNDCKRARSVDDL